MTSPVSPETLMEMLSAYPRFELDVLPTPIHPLKNFSRTLGGVDVWIKRDDMTGLEGGGNKTRKLAYLVGDALSRGADTLVTIGAIQSNHTRQTAAAAAKAGLRCALLHYAWTADAGPGYRKVGNILLSSILGADLYVDNQTRPIEDQGPLAEFGEYLQAKGHHPYLIPGGASEHPLGSLGYMACAAEIVRQSATLGGEFDYIVHCTGSSSTQSGLVAGLAALGRPTRVIGIPDDSECLIKHRRVGQLANDTLAMLGLATRVASDDYTIIACDQSHYGHSDPVTFAGIRDFARLEGLVVDPVYEGNAIRGLRELHARGHFPSGSRILLMHLGGSPAVHAYANQFEEIILSEDFQPPLQG